MKITFSHIILGAAALALSACASAAYKDGTYAGTGPGKEGPIEVSVTVKSGAIAAVDITKGKDSPGLWEAVAKKMPKKIVKANSVDVDGVTGATISSDGVKAAVKDALSKAK